MNGAVLLLILYALKACTVKTFTIPLIEIAVYVFGSKIENRFHIIFIFVLLTLMIFCVFICLFGDWAKYFMMLSVRNVARTVMLQYCLFCRYYLRYKRIYF